MGDVRHSYAAIGAARSAFGYEPKVGFMDGLALTVAWMKRRIGGEAVALASNRT
jgi:nucleoside-diphosphate-sugar epimerase